ncbi:MAG: SRPBCC domain-containing protein [Chloroflexota bacterium]|nr:SRPBCC domain-containing protein [Chloroflexota bacterium]|tara:strand:+ start:1416 stop:1823 length:408 start_codon:yes stop_codon:yes gene_type:complete
MDKAWALLLDIPQVAPCIPGVQDVESDGENQFKAVMQVRVGPVRLNFSGTINILEQDREKGEAHFRVEAADRKVGGSIRADMTMQLNELSADESELVIVTDTVFMGKIGELGQPIIRRKAKSTLEDFAKNLAKQV